MVGRGGGEGGGGEEIPANLCIMIVIVTETVNGTDVFFLRLLTFIDGLASLYRKCVSYVIRIN